MRRIYGIYQRLGGSAESADVFSTSLYLDSAAAYHWEQSPDSGELTYAGIGFFTKYMIPKWGLTTVRQFHADTVKVGETPEPEPTLIAEWKAKLTGE